MFADEERESDAPDDDFNETRRMNADPDDPRILWERYLETRSSECRLALLQHYAPAVLMQTCCWSRSALPNAGNPPADRPTRTDRMPIPPEGRPFIPYVPPPGQRQERLRQDSEALVPPTLS